jgi:hypothetical protein
VGIVIANVNAIQCVPQVQDHRRTLLFGKIRKNIKREKLL